MFQQAITRRNYHEEEQGNAQNKGDKEIGPD